MSVFTIRVLLFIFPVSLLFGQNQASLQERLGYSKNAKLLIIHTAYDNAEMRGVSVDHPDWGAAWRQADYDFFSSEECSRILEEEDIQLITWREIGQLMQE